MKMFGFGIKKIALFSSGRHIYIQKKCHTLFQYNKLVSTAGGQFDHNLKLLPCNNKKDLNLQHHRQFAMPRNLFSNYVLQDQIWLCEMENKLNVRKILSKTDTVDKILKSDNNYNIQNIENPLHAKTLNGCTDLSNIQEYKINSKCRNHSFFKENVLAKSLFMFRKTGSQNVFHLITRNYATHVNITNEVKLKAKRGKRKSVESVIDETILNLGEPINLNNNNINLYNQSIDNELQVKTNIKTKSGKHNISQINELNKQTEIQAEESEQNNNQTEIQVENSVQNKTLNADILKKPSNICSNDFLQLKKEFPVPKNTLHNIFDVLAIQLNNKSLQLKPKYTLVKSSKKSLWECMYHLKWPEDIVFKRSAVNKRDASDEAALLVLHYLKINNKINDKQPLIHKELADTDSKLIKINSICFNHNIIEKLQNISLFYEKELSLLLKQHVYTDSIISNSTDQDFEASWPENNRKMSTFRGLQHYLAKEPVKLPISEFKDNIIKTIQNNQVVIIKGEPGCGKSTRVPQYVLEGWGKEMAEGESENQNCKVVVTQPRRIAALSLSERVANERQEMVGSTVGYQVRLKSNFNKKTGHILYCTTGILLRRLQSDPRLMDCSHIILDEAHERDVNTDLLINLLRYAIKLNPNLKLIVMSATINTNIFQTYFNDAPIVNIPGFSYPVKINYLDESQNLDKTMKMCEGKEPSIINDEVAKLIRLIHETRPEGAILCFLPGWDDIVKIRNLLEDYSQDKVVLCLHSRLQDTEQRKIFSKPPPGVRKIILATNIAETSVTIDDVVYVIDCGIQKEKRFDVEKGIDCIDNHWISKASMIQRKGRAGRCQPGESFHLYPEEKYNEFIDYSVPEILRTSLTKIVLDSKVYSNNMKALDFMNQLLTPPDPIATLRAVDELKDLNLLDENENLTPLGRTLSDFQLEPKLGKAMVNSVIYQCVTPVVDIITLFSSEMELFASGLTDKESINRKKKEFSRNSDHLSLMRLFERWLEFNENRDNYMASRFCNDNNLVEYKLTTIQKLREIHYNYLHRGLHNILPISDSFSDNDELVKGVLLSGVGTVLQHRNYDIVKGRSIKKNVLLTRNNHKATITSESVNFKRGVFPSNYLLYINETRSNIRRITVVRETSLISPIAVLLFKNNKLIINEIPKTKFSDELKSEDQVIIKLEDTKIEFIIDRRQAEVIKKCKEDLNSCYDYYVHQLTKGAEYNSSVNESWGEILQLLNSVLQSSGVTS